MACGSIDKTYDPSKASAQDNEDYLLRALLCDPKYTDRNRDALKRVLRAGYAASQRRDWWVLAKRHPYATVIVVATCVLAVMYGVFLLTALKDALDAAHPTHATAVTATVTWTVVLLGATVATSLIWRRGAAGVTADSLQYIVARGFSALFNRMPVATYEEYLAAAVRDVNA